MYFKDISKNFKITNRVVFIRKQYLTIIIVTIIFALLYYLSLYSYLLYHSLAEIFSIVIAAGIFMVAWNSRKFMDNNYFLFIGISYLFVAFLDLIYTLVYPGMGVFPGYGSNLAAQLWISARYVESIALLVAIFFIGRKIKHILTFLIYSLIMIVIFLSIFHWKIFPDCFIEGMGLTVFKVISEYIISAILLASIFLILKKRNDFDKKVFKLLILSIIVTIFSELALAIYENPYGIMNQVGHYFKIVSFYLIYKAIIENGLKRPYSILFRKLKKNELELERKNHRLALVNEELESFSYSVSHDLHAPLRSIDGFSQALLEDCSSKLNREGKDFLNRIRASTKKMAKLIDDMLTLSRITRKKVNYSEVNLSKIANTIVKDLNTMKDKRKVKFKIVPNLTAKADAGLMRIVLENLLGNAYKFTRKSDDAKIEFGVTNVNGDRAYFINDNGAGFDMNYANKLFIPFQRLHSEYEYNGTGIGLAIVQRVMHLHNGRVWAEGEVRKGATFYFTIQ
jgi:signal transduction histidine kinase